MWYLVAVDKENGVQSVWPVSGETKTEFENWILGLGDRGFESIDGGWIIASDNDLLSFSWILDNRGRDRGSLFSLREIQSELDSMLFYMEDCDS